jgi:hypothetical protein
MKRRLRETVMLWLGYPNVNGGYKKAPYQIGSNLAPHRLIMKSFKHLQLFLYISVLFKAAFSAEKICQLTQKAATVVS